MHLYFELHLSVQWNLLSYKGVQIEILIPFLEHASLFLLLKSNSVKAFLRNVIPQMSAIQNNMCMKEVKAPMTSQKFIHKKGCPSYLCLSHWSPMQNKGTLQRKPNPHVRKAIQIFLAREFQPYGNYNVGYKYHYTSNLTIESYPKVKSDEAFHINLHSLLPEVLYF